MNTKYFIRRNWAMGLLTLLVCLPMTVMSQTERFEMVVEKTDGTELVFRITEDYPLLQYNYGGEEGVNTLQIETATGTEEVPCPDIKRLTTRVSENLDVLVKIGDSGKTTLTSSKALDFSDFSDLKAYVATGYESNGTIWLTRINQVPANTPVLIKGEAGKSYDVPILDQSAAYFENMFQGSATENLTISTTTSDGKYKNFYMASGQFKPVSDKGQTIKAGKCYLQVPASFKKAVSGASPTVKIAESGKSSYAPPVDVDLTGVEGLKAYAATGYDAASQTIWLTRINKIQAGEGVMLKGEGNKTYTLPAAEVQAYYGNMIIGNIGDPITINETSDDGEWANFYLAKGKFNKVSGSREIGTNKSYLHLPTSLLVSSARGKKNVGIDEWLMEELETEVMYLGSIGGEDDGTTKINAIRQENAQPDVYYNLQGQRVDNPRKGIYIRNGKMVVIQ